MFNYHWEKNRNFANHPKLCGNCAFPQNFHTRKLGEITVFFSVYEKHAKNNLLNGKRRISGNIFEINADLTVEVKLKKL